MKNRKQFFYLSLLCLLAFSPFASAVTDGEGDFHYRNAENSYNNKNTSEAIRVLREIVYYYDTENLPSYQLLIKIYKEKGDKRKVKAIEKSYEKAKVIKAARAAGTLKDLSPAEALEKGLPQQRIDACRTLADSDNVNNIPLLVTALGDPYFDFYYGIFEVRKAASEALLKFGSKALPALVEAASSKDDDIRAGAMKTLSMMAPPDKNGSRHMEEVFIKAMRDPDTGVRAAGLKGAAELFSEKAVPSIIALLNDTDTEIRLNAAMALGPLCAELNKSSINKQVSEGLVQSLNDTDKAVAGEAIKTLARVGDIKELTPVLLAIAKDEKRETLVRWYAVKSLGTMLSENDVKQLEKLLESDNPWLRGAAAVALGRPLSESQVTVSSSTINKGKEAIDDTFLKLTLDAPQVFEEARRQGIDKGLRYLASMQKEDGSFDSFYPMGTTQLALMSFLRQGFTVDFPVVKRGLDYMMRQRRPDGSFYSDVRSLNEEPGKNKIVFTTSLAIQILGKIDPQKYAKEIADAAGWIKSVQNSDGGFGYYKGLRSDITATRYAITGLDAAYTAMGREKNDETWLKSQNYLATLQNEDGGFGYSKTEQRSSYGSATASGIICLNMAGMDTKRVYKGIEWASGHYGWDTNPLDSNPKHYQYYIQEMAEAFHRTGRTSITDATGRAHYWFDEVAKKLLAEQDRNGWWVTDKEPLFTTYLIGTLQLEQARARLEGM